MATSPEEPKMRTIKDPIHDFMPAFSKKVSSIIDTPHFQRLRHIKQLGTTYRVYPGASHNRFEHCLGVAHLARSMATHLQTSQPELHITARDVECVQIAGLCHDLGHGPWSHVWDGLFIPVVAPPADGEKPWQHEDASKMMFEDLIRFLKEHGLVPEDHFPEKDVRFVLALIDGEESHCDPDEKSFLFDIVANKRNGLDVDKFDYIARDTYMMGIPSTVPSWRIIQSARVIDGEICFNIKDVNLLLNIGASRFGLHKEQYNHKTAKAIEYMIVDALKLAEPFLKIAGRIKSPKTFLHLTDNIEQEIKASTSDELKPARDLLDAIDIRNLYKQVDERFIEWGEHRAYMEGVTSARIVEEALRIAEDEMDDSSLDVSELTPESVIVDMSILHYGKKEANPLDKVKFYSKHNPNQSAHAERGDYSTLMPQYFAELKLSVFTKLPQYFGLVQAGWRAVSACIIEELNRPSTPTPDRPRKPKSTASLGSLGGNSFTAVPVTYAPDTPGGKPLSSSQKSNSQKSTSQKRSREGVVGGYRGRDEGGEEASKVVKSLTLEWTELGGTVYRLRVHFTYLTYHTTFHVHILGSGHSE
ncbi:Glycoside hydrolase family 3 protein [Mycena chlorophos]|uniref:Glycoside hydrolase family 3 protein n=1 Tax=Mycena chlorophos TaxID=658473 RepID=A0A8H6S4B6_MYCCL|nr:Glycoside hydrolase family 3 protein [Mycena chlorophos]